MREIQVKLNEGSVQCRTTLSLKFFFAYQSEKEKFSKIDDFEKRFRYIAFLLIDQDDLQPITYEEFDEITTGRLKNIANHLLKHNKNVKSSFINTTKKHAFFRRMCEAIEAYIMSIVESLKNTMEPIIALTLEVKAVINIPSVIQSFEKMNNVIQTQNKAISQNISALQTKINSFSDTTKVLSQKLSETVSGFQNIFPNDLIKTISTSLLRLNKLEDMVTVHALSDGWFNFLEVKYEVIEHLFKSELMLDDLIDDPQLLTKEINVFMERHYTNDLIETRVEDWINNKVLKRRYHIIKSALEAHQRHEYFLSVPVLFAQLEGIVRENLHVNKEIDMSNSDMIKYLKSIDVDEKIIEKMIKYFRRSLYVRFKEGEKLKSDLGRNAILHGYDVSYGNKINSLKLIFIFETVLKGISSKMVIS